MKSWFNRSAAILHRFGSKGCNRQPDYHIYDLIWSIPEEYGGMTSATLYRCWQFRHYGVGRSLTILTLQIGLDVKWAQKHIWQRWQVPKTVCVRNIWHDLRRASDDGLMQLSGDTPDGLNKAERRPGSRKFRPYCHEFRNGSGKAVRREHLREDGSLLLLVGLDDNRRAAVLYDSTGEPIKQWPTTQDLYLAWLDWVIERRPAVLINEHRNISKFLYRATMADVKTCQVVHGTHQKGTRSPYNELNSRASLVCNLANFDLVSILTEWQQQDLLALGVEADNLRIMPNATEPATQTTADVTLAKKGGQQRCDHCTVF